MEEEHWIQLSGWEYVLVVGTLFIAVVATVFVLTGVSVG